MADGTGVRVVERIVRAVAGAVVAAAVLSAVACAAGERTAGRSSPATAPPAPARSLALPGPRTSGPLTVEEALAQRRSVRVYRDEPMTVAQLSQLLWAAQGVTESEHGLRTVPSAGALYPLEVYVAVARVDGIPAGVYHYAAAAHRLDLVVDRPVGADLAAAALRQPAVSDAPVVLAVAAVYARSTVKYGDRGRRYVHLEAGHAAQNIYLQAAALGLGTVSIGAFDDEGVQAALSLKPDEAPLYLLPVGAPAPP